MVELDQFKYTLSTYDETLKEVKDSLDLENKERRITELDKSMEEPGFWDDPERSTKTVREAKNLKDTVDGDIGVRTFPNIHDFHPQLRIADAPPDQSRIEHKGFDKTIARAAQYLILFRFADSAGGIGAAVYCECLVF